MSRRMICSFSGVLRSWSVSSMRRMKVPPVLRAQSQLKSAVRTPPMWRYPVGDGAKRRRGLPAMRRRVARSRGYGGAWGTEPARGGGVPCVRGARLLLRRRVPLPRESSRAPRGETR